MLGSRFFHQSFRVKGIDDGQFDQICRALGLSGPEDLAIPTADWESRKSLDLTPRSRLQSLFHSVCSSSDGSSSSNSSAGLMSLSSNSRDTTCSNLVGDFQDGDRARFCRSSYCKLEKEEFALKEDTSSIGNEARGSQGGEFGGLNCGSKTELAVGVGVSEGAGARGRGGSIKGLRPQILTPPPVIFRHMVDNVSSTWDICRSFGPQDGDIQENEVIISQCCSLTTSKDEDIEDKDDVGSSFDSGMSFELVHIISPNGKFR